MALKPENSLVIGLATAALVYGIYTVNLPNTASVRASKANNQHIDSARKTATWEAAGIVAGVAILAHDPTVFVIGGATLIAIDFAHRIANSTDSVTGQISGSVASTGVDTSASAEVNT